MRFRQQCNLLQRDKESRSKIKDNQAAAFSAKLCIGVAPITQYTHARNENSNIQGSSPYVVSDLRNCPKRKEFATPGSKRSSHFEK